MSDCLMWSEIRTDLLVGGRGTDCNAIGGIPVERAVSISLIRCSNAAVFFRSSLRSFFCWLKWRAYFFVVTERLEVIPVFPVISVRWVLLLDLDSMPSRS